MMLARVADSLYWMGRYVERAEHLCRLSDVMLTATLDRTEAASQVARKRQAPAAYLGSSGPSAKVERTANAAAHGAVIAEEKPAAKRPQPKRGPAQPPRRAASRPDTAS